MIGFHKHNGKYGFMSNFYPAEFDYNGIHYLNSEAAFQAQKCPDRAREFSKLPANEAKYLGRKVSLRPDWEAIKDRIMYEVVYAKFSQNYELKEKLLETGDEEIIEVTTWCDKYWGICTCRWCSSNGLNMLGKILVQVRNELKENR